MPETERHAPLPATRSGAEHLASQIPGPPVMIGPEATRARVLYALPHVNIAHFACHAGSDPANPAASHLLLQDGPLDMSTITKLRLERAELVYLSACATARGGVKFADEALHIASAFQFSGFSQAVATLWEIDDESAAAAADFYRQISAVLNQQVRIPGAALHDVVRRMRATNPATPSTWAAFVHYGA